MSNIGASLVARTVKNLPAMQETSVRSLRQEDSLEKERTTHSIFLPVESHGQRSLVGLWGHKQLDMIEQYTHTHTHICNILGISDIQLTAVIIFLCCFTSARVAH